MMKFKIEVEVNADKETISIIGVRNSEYEERIIKDTYTVGDIRNDPYLYGYREYLANIGEDIDGLIDFYLEKWRKDGK